MALAFFRNVLNTLSGNLIEADKVSRELQLTLDKWKEHFCSNCSGVTLVRRLAIVYVSKGCYYWTFYLCGCGHVKPDKRRFTIDRCVSKTTEPNNKTTRKRGDKRGNAK